jgi:hypothetical protein
MSQTIIRPAQHDVRVVDSISVTPTPVPAMRSLVAFATASCLAGSMVYLVSVLVGRIGS